MCNGLVEIAGEAAFLKEFHADILLGGHGVGQPNRHDEANKHGFEGHALLVYTQSVKGFGVAVER